MYQLYYYPLNASMAPHFVLAALEVDYQLTLVDRKSNAQKSAEYLALNPAGKIPTLVHEDFALTESPAICLYLAEQHPSSGLLAESGSKERAKCLQWMMYLSNTLQAALMVYFYPLRHTTEGQEVKNIVLAQEARIVDMFSLLDNELLHRSYLVGDSVTVCDFFLFMLAIWADELKTPPLALPNLAKYLKRMAKIKAIKDVCEKEGLSLKDYR